MNLNCPKCQNAIEQCSCKEDEINQPPLADAIAPAHKQPFVTLQKILKAIGISLAVVFALACGITTAGTLIMLLTTLHIFSGGVTTFILAGILFTATTATNIKICKQAVPDVLIDIFGKGRFMAGLTQSDTGKSLSRGRLFAMTIGVLLALSAGATFAALSYSSVFTLTAVFTFLGAISIALPPIAIVLGVVTFICLSALMLKAIANIIKTENLLNKCKDYLKDLIDTNPDLERNKGKSPTRILIERGLTVVLTAVTLPVALIGLSMIMMNCTQGLGHILMKIPHASPTIVRGVSYGLGLVIAQIAQIPFVVKTAINTIKSIFERSPKSAKPEAEKSSPVAKFTESAIWGTGQALRTLNAAGNGLLAVAGSSHHLVLASLAGAGGFQNSFAAASESNPTPVITSQQSKISLPNSTDTSANAHKSVEKNSQNNISVKSSNKGRQPRTGHSNSFFSNWYNDATKEKNNTPDLKSVYLKPQAARSGTTTAATLGLI